MRLFVYIAASLDGFIARENGGLDWLPGAEKGKNGDDYEFKEFFDSIDVLVMGRNTYEMVLSFGEWPYGKKRVIVLSSRQIKIPANLSNVVEKKAGSPAELVEELYKEGIDRIYVDGGKTIQGFLKAGLINELIITRIPILIGQGIPLFGQLDNDIDLKLLGIRSFDNGMVQGKYEVVQKPD